VLKRRDGLYAYHLAVVSDDIQQGITEIVRGSDLLEVSGCHLSLYRSFASVAPQYVHIPVISTEPGKKLSKQNHAPPLVDEKASCNLIQALRLLNHTPPAALSAAPVAKIVEWAEHNWQLSRVAKKREILLGS